ncbi:uncharacterized protein LOC18770376 [Prunus persica]|uniref:uncharacterized protein LOC18770376 n=1 Tax=Prunus persica TaxID=3760 RepID=UPI0009AB4449|nr:uncharacterized protein LOC18770376 [Prunus persica]
MEETDSDSEDDDDESGHARGEIKRENDMPTKKDFGGSSSNQIFVKRTPDVLGRTHPLTKSEKALALQRANAFKSEYPYFLVAIPPVYIHRGYLVSFPYNTLVTPISRYQCEKRLSIDSSLSKSKKQKTKSYIYPLLLRDAL